MNDLPKVYVNPIDKEFNNYQEKCDPKDYVIKKDSRNLSVKIKDIFSSRNYVYKTKVRVKTTSGTFDKILIGKANGYLLMMDGEKLKLSDVLDIETIT